MLQAAGAQGLKYVAIVIEVAEFAREDVAWARREISRFGI